jgi:Ca-activated chloride channel family protein
LSTLEGGEVGSGNGITAIFEIVPFEESYYFDDFLNPDDIAWVNINYHLPDENTDNNVEYTCTNNYLDYKYLCSDLKFATTLTMFGLLLRDSKYSGLAAWNTVEKMAKEFKSKDDYLQNQFISIIENAKKIYSKKIKKKIKY